MAMFVAGIIIAILASSLISIVIATQFVVGEQGPEGPQGATGPVGATGATGPEGPPGILNPDYDSGWVERADRIFVEFNHNLGTSDIFVYILVKWYRDWEGSGGPMVHQFYYGGDSYGDPQRTQGFYWDCYTEDPNSIHVSCYDRTDEIRVLIWKLPEP